MNGILNLNKDEGMTSFLAVKLCRGIFKTKKAGHAGTLDPLATGVLPIFIGNACGAASYFLAEKKTYRATFRVGIATDTEDVTGTVTDTSSVRPSLSAWQDALKPFLGKSLQVPPMYSALKKDGRPLYELARRGESVEREAREIEVFELSLEEGEEEDTFVLCATGSGGTYIRTLICDVARRAGTLATMTSLCRTRHHEFDIQHSVTLSEIREMLERGEDLSRLLFPVEEAFSDFPEIRLPAFYEKLMKNGCEIYASRARVGRELALGERVRVLSEDGTFFALAEKRQFPEGEAFKALKLFL